MLLSKPTRQIYQRRLIKSHRLKGGRKGGGRNAERVHQHRRFFLFFVFLLIKIIKEKWVASILHEMEVMAASYGVFS